MTQPLPVPTICLDRDPAVVGREIVETLRTVGFFQAVDRGVDESVAGAAWHPSHDFFDLPLADKHAGQRPEGGLYGYFPMLESLSASWGGRFPGDLKVTSPGRGVISGCRASLLQCDEPPCDGQ